MPIFKLSVSVVCSSNGFGECARAQNIGVLQYKFFWFDVELNILTVHHFELNTLIEKSDYKHLTHALNTHHQYILKMNMWGLEY